CLVPADLTVGRFVYVVRNRIRLRADKEIFIFNKDEDDFLYMTYRAKNTFGLL
ncbi:hypothetical protein MKW92_053292, partial [Papaver armeniacum]